VGTWGAVDDPVVKRDRPDKWADLIAVPVTYPSPAHPFRGTTDPLIGIAAALR